MSRSRISLVLALSITPLSVAAAQECTTHYCFSFAVLESLKKGHTAYALWPDSGIAACLPSGNTTGVDVLYSAKQRTNQFHMARATLDPYRASDDSILRNTIELLDGAYTIHMRLAAKTERYCRLLADGKIPPGFETPSQMADSAANDKVALDMALRSLIAAVGELGFGLSAIDHRTNKLTILLLTNQERQEILSTLRRDFGPEVASNKPLSTDFADAGVVFYHWLSDPRWQTIPASR